LFKVAVVLLALTSAISVQAQVTTGTVRGEVTDQAGAVVPGATVTITDPKTKTSQTAQSGSNGEYQFNNLPVGTYVITVQPPSDDARAWGTDTSGYDGFAFDAIRSGLSAAYE
jgi:type 1 fimbria pilin